MAEVKDKIVTVESLSALHEHNKNTYLPMVDPTGSGTMTIDGINVGFIMLGNRAKLVPANDRLEIVFLDIGDIEIEGSAPSTQGGSEGTNSGSPEIPLNEDEV